MPPLCGGWPGWSESDSRKFIDLGWYFVPEREKQAAIFTQLLSSLEKEDLQVVDICCGEGLLSLHILKKIANEVLGVSCTSANDHM